MKTLRMKGRRTVTGTGNLLSDYVFTDADHARECQRQRSHEMPCTNEDRLWFQEESGFTLERRHGRPTCRPGSFVLCSFCRLNRRPPAGPH